MPTSLLPILERTERHADKCRKLRLRDIETLTNSQNVFPTIYDKTPRRFHLPTANLTGLMDAFKKLVKS